MKAKKSLQYIQKYFQVDITQIHFPDDFVSNLVIVLCLCDVCAPVQLALLYGKQCLWYAKYSFFKMCEIGNEENVFTWLDLLYMKHDRNIVYKVISILYYFLFAFFFFETNSFKIFFLCFKTVNASHNTNWSYVFTWKQIIITNFNCNCFNARINNACAHYYYYFILFTSGWLYKHFYFPLVLPKTNFNRM